MAIWSTSAWVLHDLGLAAGFGGALYGKLALRPAAGEASSRQERGRIINAAWRRYAPLNLLGHAAFSLTWATGRKMLSGRSLGRGTRRLVRAKDALVIGSVATGVASQILGWAVESDVEGMRLAPEPGGQPAPATLRETRAKVRAVSRIGAANLLMNAGLIAVTATLAMKSSESNAFPFIGRLLP